MGDPKEYCCFSSSTSAETVKTSLLVAGFLGQRIKEEDEEDNGEVRKEISFLQGKRIEEIKESVVLILDLQAGGEEEQEQECNEEVKQ